MARAFRFSLETLLRLRNLHEREARRKVGAKHAEIARLDQLNDATREEIHAVQDALRDRQLAEQIDPIELTRQRAWIAHLRRTIAQRLGLRSELLAELAQLQQALTEARRQTKTIEKLRERRYAAWRRQRERDAQAEADELAQQLHIFGGRRPARPAAMR